MSFRFPPALPQLATPRLVLGSLVDSDRDALFAIHGDAEAMRYWSTPPWADAAPAAELLRRDPDEFGRGEAIR
ncbi:MAG TPA: hypothetical protein VLV15_03530, partial [Dongiaceae bacterium]|nr:hypothetical protein [Dongiaceae bacterium]